MKMIKYGQIEGFHKTGEDIMFLPTENRVEKVISVMGNEWFEGKTILELGTAHGLIGRHFEKLGATVTYADGRQELLDAIDTDSEKLLINHNEEWSYDRKWDLIIHFGVLYHVKDFRKDLEWAFNHSDTMWLETAVITEGEVHHRKWIEKVHRVYNGVDQWEAAFQDKHVEEYLDSIGKTYYRYDDTSLDTEIGIVVEHEKYLRHVYSWTYEDVHPPEGVACKFGGSFPNVTHFRRMWFVTT